MKTKTFKKIISGTVSAMMIATSIPFSSTAANGNIDLGSVTNNNVGGGFGDWGGFGGNGGGMNWGGFGGDNGGGMDWSGFAGGFNGGGAQIGGDAGNGGNAKSGLNAEI
ncbi:hypothetical protein, partial [Ruminococcus sp.]|uniref:hypothetical protein n=1 Tax=Ruminococcus sp. TaxID=41978 RepID=UPI0025EE18ED